MQQKNLWLFLLLSVAILWGWSMIRPMIIPPPPKKEKVEDKTAENGQPHAKDDQKPKVKTKPKQKPKTEPPALWAKRPASELSQIAARLMLAPTATCPGAATNFVAVFPALAGVEEATDRAIQIALKAKKKQTTQPQPVETVVLGGDDYYVKAVLTTSGAGVQKLTLTKFQAANWKGLPVYEEDGEPMPLHLIPEDPFRPSFLMFHYPDPELPDGDDSRPYTTLGERVWKLESNTKDKRNHTITFTTDGPRGYEHLTLRKIFSLNADQYHITLTVEIEDDSNAKGERQPFRYQLAGPHGLPIEGGWYTYVHRNAVVGMVDSSDRLWRTLVPAKTISYQKGGDRVPQGNRGSSAVQYAGVCTQFFASVIAVSNKQVEGIDKKHILAYARPTLETQEKKCFVDDIAEDGAKVKIRLQNEARTKLEAYLLPDAHRDLKSLRLEPGASVIAHLYTSYKEGEKVWVAAGFRRGDTLKPFLDDITVRVVSEPVELESGEKVAHKYVLYNGPVKIRQLGVLSGDEAVDYNLVERYADTLHLATLTDYPSVTWLSWWSDVLIACTKLMHWLLGIFLWLLPIKGLAIILLTVVVRGLMFPISRKQALTAMRMQELAPELKKLQEKYKNDMQARQQAVMELYRRHNVNPFSGCLPLFLQLPIFLGLFYALQESISFRLASFLWIQNMAAPDMLFYWGQGMPWITDPDSQGGMLYLGPYFNLLPVLAVAIMLAHQKLMMPKAMDEQQEMQQKMMKYMMVFIGILFYKVAAGLCIYFIASSLWGVAERKLLPKKKQHVPVAADTPPSTKGAPSKDGAKPTPAQRRKAKGKGKAAKREEPDTAMKKVRNWWEEVLKQAKKK